MIKILSVGLDSSLSVALRDDARFEFVSATSTDEARTFVESRDSGWDAILVHPEHDLLSWILDQRLEQALAAPVVVVMEEPNRDASIEALDAGADDAVDASDLDLLVARLAAVIRCNRAVPVLRFGDVSIDVAKRSVRRERREVTLTPKEFDFVMVLARSAGRPVPRSVILERVWEYDGEPGTPVLEVLVSRLRRRLRTIDTDLIETTANQGYRLVTGVPTTS